MNFGPRLELARHRRQEYERLVRMANERGRPADYANAMQAAISYVSVVDGILAAFLDLPQPVVSSPAIDEEAI